MQGNDADACTVMGRFLIKGDKGMESNITKGVEFLRRGCKMGDRTAAKISRSSGSTPTNPLPFPSCADDFFRRTRPTPAALTWTL